MKDSNALWKVSQEKMLLYILLIFSQLFTNCVATKKFNPPKNLPQPDQIKRLIVFRASVVDINERGKSKKWAPEYPLLGIQNGNKRMINISQPLSGNCTYVFEMDVTDTGSITFLMGPERPLLVKNFYTNTTIHFKDLAIGNNYWHLNYYLKGVRKIGWVPALTLKEIDISKDSFKDNIITNFRYALRYDLSADSIMYEKKKAIVSKQKSINRIYKRILNSNTSVDSLSATK